MRLKVNYELVMKKTTIFFTIKRRKIKHSAHKERTE